MGERGEATLSLIVLGGLAVASVLWRTLDLILCAVLGGLLVLVGVVAVVTWAWDAITLSWECRRPVSGIRPPKAAPEVAPGRKEPAP